MSFSIATVIPKVERKAYPIEVQEYETACPDFDTLEMTGAKKEFFFRALRENEVYQAGMSTYYDCLEATCFGDSLRTKEGSIVYYATDAYGQWIAMIAEIYPFKHIHRLNFHFFIPFNFLSARDVTLREGYNYIRACFKGQSYQRLKKSFKKFFYPAFVLGQEGTLIAEIENCQPKLRERYQWSGKKECVKLVRDERVFEAKISLAELYYRPGNLGYYNATTW